MSAIPQSPRRPPHELRDLLDLIVRDSRLEAVQRVHLTPEAAVVTFHVARGPSRGRWSLRLEPWPDFLP